MKAFLKVRPQSLPTLRINSIEHLAMQLGVRASVLQQLAHELSCPRCTYYKLFTKMKNEKCRVVRPPRGLLKQVLYRIKRLLDRLELLPYVHGGVKGRSTLSYALPHVGRRRIIRADIEKCFPSISHKRVYKLFCNELACSPDVARILTRLTTFHGQLPLGSPTSTVISNLCTGRLALRLDRLAAKRGLNFGQYVDDFTFSCDTHIKRLPNLIAHICEQEGFRCNNQQMKVIDSQDEQVIVGIKVNRKIDVPQEYISALESEINEYCREDYLRSRERDNSVRGKIAYVRRLNPREAARLEKLLPSRRPHVFGGPSGGPGLAPRPCASFLSDLSLSS